MKTDMQIRQEISHLRKQLRERKRKAHGEPKRKKGMGVRIGDRDDALKAARGYTDPSSYVRREKLAGQDWVNRKAELWLRAEGQCEQQIALVAFIDGRLQATGGHTRCVGVGRDPDHKIKRSVRRDDRLENLQLLCAQHHDLKHPEFKTQFTRRSGKVGA